ncbi:chorismate mutase [Actinoplanes hulinensis]|uniref:chorismate mutase n=1 Tax=Actinoplanes hulinensis TaxID=1144547 RepID=A0ABS7BCG4_9ACTN|nr:chorismate mutase [Actinoplanes hulinensis]MBW6438779.1 chorismate mutase [Actinoplanes hulinensis]
MIYLFVVGLTAAVTTALPPSRDLNALVNLSAERLLLADRVAAAKFGTDQPIEDPVRERQVLDRAAAMAAEAGLDATGTVAFFRAQIEAGKAVQRGLFDRWARHPERAPEHRPDLATEVRPHLDRITAAFISRLAATEDLRAATRQCGELLVSAKRAADRRHRLDPLHERALNGAIAPVCTG